MSGVEEIKSKIEYCKGAIEPYRSYGDIAVQAINALTTLEGLVTNLTEENLEKALDLTTKLDSAIAPYANFVPTVAEYIRAIKDWLEARAKK